MVVVVGVEGGKKDFEIGFGRRLIDWRVRRDCDGDLIRLSLPFFFEKESETKERNFNRNIRKNTNNLKVMDRKCEQC